MDPSNIPGKFKDRIKKLYDKVCSGLSKPYDKDKCPVILAETAGQARHVARALYGEQYCFLITQENMMPIGFHFSGPIIVYETFFNLPEANERLKMVRASCHHTNQTYFYVESMGF